MLKEELERGWQLPLLKDAAFEIKGFELAPVGMVAPKSSTKRGTHDQSFNPSGVTAGQTINNRQSGHFRKAPSQAMAQLRNDNLFGSAFILVELKRT